MVLVNMGHRLDPDPAGFTGELGLWDIGSGVEDPAGGRLDADGDCEEGGMPAMVGVKSGWVKM
jgi:hypothetical protein